VDRFLRIESLENLTAAINKKSEEGGGGSIRAGIQQYEVKGGNAVNLGYALGMYGVKVNAIAIASSLPAETLRTIFLKVPSVNLSLIHGKSGFTIAFEFMDHGRPVNVMVSDAGDLAQFDGSSLTLEHMDLIARSKIVCVVNWGANKNGNDLCQKVFSIAKENGARTFFDSADVSELVSLLNDFKKRVLDKGLVDYFSMNDNEARIMAKVFASYSLPQDYTDDELRRTASILADCTSARVDIHTRRLSLSCFGSGVTTALCHKVDQKIVTGAGDVWDAADLLGYLTGLGSDDRLCLANAAAGLYVSRISAEPPTASEVLLFLKNEEEQKSSH
jgi:ribokinase